MNKVALMNTRIQRAAWMAVVLTKPTDGCFIVLGEDGVVPVNVVL